MAQSTAGIYCSTSGTIFTDKDALAEHYKSDLHRYNLKRKVAGLPPVTAEWFEARREHLLSLQQQQSSDVIYICPLTNKKFQSEGTYENHTRTQKFKAAMKKASMQVPPPPRIVQRQSVRETQTGTTSTADVAQLQQHLSGLAVQESKPVWGPKRGAVAASDEEDAEGSDESGWETDSQVDDETIAAAINAAETSRAGTEAEDAGGGIQWQEWDVKRSLFDNHVSASFNANLAYMYKNFGFYLPDAEFLKDPEGLIRYLGAKLQHGHIALYSSGHEDSKRYSSLHAVQRHMVDSNRCTMLYDDNEDEYEDYYEYPDMEEDLAVGMPEISTNGYELFIQRPGQGPVALGNREFKHLYRQKHKPAGTGQAPSRELLISYHNMGVPGVSKEEVQKRVQKIKHDRRRNWNAWKSQTSNDKIFNLKKNVPH